MATFSGYNILLAGALVLGVVGVVLSTAKSGAGSRGRRGATGAQGLKGDTGATNTSSGATGFSGILPIANGGTNSGVPLSGDETFIVSNGTGYVEGPPRYTPDFLEVHFGSTGGADVVLVGGSPAFGQVVVIPALNKQSEVVLTEGNQLVNGVKSFQDGVLLGLGNLNYTPTNLNAYAEFTQDPVSFQVQFINVVFNTFITLTYVRVGRQVTLQVNGNSALFDLGGPPGSVAICNQLVPLFFRPSQEVYQLIKTQANVTPRIGALEVNSAGQILIYNDALSQVNNWDAINNQFGSPTVSWVV